jgi:hypothetical protein
LGRRLSVKQEKKRPTKLFHNDAFYEELLNEMWKTHNFVSILEVCTDK